jgi:hypothetical protein
MTLQGKALEIAITQLGVRESPGNRNTGRDVEKYLSSVGLGPGYAWCMAFVYWCFENGAITMARKTPLKRTGGVLDQWNARKVNYSVSTAMPGDIFIMNYGKGQGHTGMIVSISADGLTAKTIEGNTNDEGSREGYEVCYRERKLSSFFGLLRFE